MNRIKFRLELGRRTSYHIECCDLAIHKAPRCCTAFAFVINKVSTASSLHRQVGALIL